MPRKSKVVQLDPELRRTVDRLIREGGYTLRDILDKLHELDPDVEISQSSLQRYRANAEASFEKVRQAREISKVWIEQLGEEPEGDVGRLVAELIRTIAFEHLNRLNGADEAQAKKLPMNVMLLAKAIKESAQAEKVSTDREAKIREEVEKELKREQQKQAKAAKQEAKRRGLSEEDAAALENAFLGLGGDG